MTEPDQGLLPPAKPTPTSEGTSAHAGRSNGSGIDAEHAALSASLIAQRQSALAIIDGLAEAELRHAVVPSGWTPLAGDVRTVVLHMIEETARHAGHLDIARELIDGRTGLGAR